MRGWKLPRSGAAKPARNQGGHGATPPRRPPTWRRLPRPRPHSQGACNSTPGTLQGINGGSMMRRGAVGPGTALAPDGGRGAAPGAGGAANGARGVPAAATAPRLRALKAPRDGTVRCTRRRMGRRARGAEQGGGDRADQGRPAVWWREAEGVLWRGRGVCSRRRAAAPRPRKKGAPGAAARGLCPRSPGGRAGGDGRQRPGGAQFCCRRARARARGVIHAWYRSLVRLGGAGGGQGRAPGRGAARGARINKAQGAAGAAGPAKGRDRAWPGACGDSADYADDD